jgi:hypothetical protein
MSSRDKSLLFYKASSFSKKHQLHRGVYISAGLPVILLSCRIIQVNKNNFVGLANSRKFFWIATQTGLQNLVERYEILIHANILISKSPNDFTVKIPVIR